MKHELKDVLHYYLPYKLKIETHGYFGDCELTTIEFSDILEKSLDKEWNWKPILKPLSTVIDDLAEWLYSQKVESFDSKEEAKGWIDIMILDPTDLPFDLVEKALSLHGDIFGLLESGQAIEKKFN